MKRALVFTLLFALPMVLFTTAYAGGDKGKWSKKDRKKFAKAMEEQNEVLDAMGDMKDPFVDCYFEKLQANYEGFAEADNDHLGAKRFASQCIQELNIGGEERPSKSMEGLWSRKDVVSFYKEMDGIWDSLEALGEKRVEFIECYLKVLESSYQNFDEANSDAEGAGEAAEKCVSVLGNE